MFNILIYGATFENMARIVKKFNSKWENYLIEGFYGLDIDNKEVIAYLDQEFQNEIKENPNFTFKQIKIKIGFCRIYATTSKKKMGNQD